MEIRNEVSSTSSSVDGTYVEPLAPDVFDRSSLKDDEMGLFFPQEDYYHSCMSRTFLFLLLLDIHVIIFAFC